jgi:hypothetical protein
LGKTNALNNYPRLIFLLIIFVITGDEILAINGASVAGASHSEAIGMFKCIRSGQVLLHVARRVPSNTRRQVARRGLLGTDAEIYQNQYIYSIKFLKHNFYK